MPKRRLRESAKRWRLILEVAACGKHFDTEALTIDARNGTERFRCGAVQQGTGRRTEHERIGQNGAAQKTRDLRRNLKALFFINGIDDGRRAADGLVAEIHRCHRLEGADAVVIDDFQNFCFRSERAKRWSAIRPQAPRRL